MAYPINNKETLNVYRSSRLFTHLCLKDDTLYGFKFIGDKLTILSSKGYYPVTVLQAASSYDDALYVKFKGIIYKYDSNDRSTPWSALCHVN